MIAATATRNRAVDRSVRGNPVKHRIKTVLFFLLYYSGLEFLISKLISCDAAAILMYHGVCESPRMPEDINFHVTPRMLDRHLRFLKRRCRPVTLGQLVDMFARRQNINKAVVITFDDGYRNNATYAAPILFRHKAPATIFLTTGYVGTSDWIPLNELYALWAAGKASESELRQWRERIRLNPRDEASDAIEEIVERARTLDRAPARDSFDMLTWLEVRELAYGGIEFGGHTHSHCSLALEDDERQKSELTQSRQLIEEQLGRRVRTFAYPYGRPPYINDASGAMVRECGYECAVSTEIGLATRRSDPFRLPRVGYQKKVFLFAGELSYLFVKQRVRELLTRNSTGGRH